MTAATLRGILGDVRLLRSTLVIAALGALLLAGVAWYFDSPRPAREPREGFL